MLNQISIERIDEYRDNYQQDKSVVIENFMDVQFSNVVRDKIEERDAWDIVTLREKRPFLVGNKEFSALPARTRGSFINEIIMGANKEDFHYLYEFVRLIGPDSKDEPEFGQIKDFIQSESFKGFFQKIIGEQIVSVDAKITKYSAGYFLKQHSDVANDGEAKRAAAFVISLTRNWRADWGGLLNIQNDDNSIKTTITPSFNSVALFKVPQEHFVSQVANFCSEHRYSITGWLWK